MANNFAPDRRDTLGRRIHPGDGSGRHHFDSTVVKFMARHVASTADQCWPWHGAIAPTGYGTLGSRYAHRIAWEIAGNSIPEGMTIDHLCRNRRCVNPAHMEVVTRAENARRVDQQHWTECKRGHDLTDEANRYWRKDGSYRCRACALLRSRRRAAA